MDKVVYIRLPYPALEEASETPLCKLMMMDNVVGHLMASNMQRFDQCYLVSLVGLGTLLSSSFY